MKKLLLAKLFLFSILAFSQEKKLLPNEIQPLYRKTQRLSPNWRNSSLVEVFINTIEGGRYKITIDDQTIENSTGMFRFFDLKEGVLTLYIYENETLIYKTYISTKNQYRLVLEFSNNKLFLVDKISLNKGYNSSNTPHNISTYHEIKVISNEEFKKFFTYFQGQSFDDGKLKAFNTTIKSIYFTSSQIAKLVKEMSFDKNKLTLAKTAYKNCIDPYNYYQVVDSLDFPSTKKDLSDYISR